MSESEDIVLVAEPVEGALSPELAQTAEAARSLAEDSLAANTRRCYRADWNKWLHWCEQHGMDPLGPPGQLALYLADLVERGVKVSTIDRAVSAITLAYKTAGKPSPRQDAAVAAVYRGARRRIGIAPEQVAAILPTQLQRMVEAMPTTLHHKLRSARNRAALAVGFFGGFRRSELLALDVADVTFVPEGLRIVIRRSKTDQEGRGRTLGIPYSSVLSVCPVRSLREWLDVAGITEGAIFRSISKDGLEVLDSRLCSRQFADVVKSSAQRIGLQGKYAAHSLRAGLVTAAVGAKKNPKAIMAQTGHKTMDMIMRYVREQSLFDDNAAAGLL
jgi:integrase